MTVWQRGMVTFSISLVMTIEQASAFLIDVNQSTGNPIVQWTQTASGSRTANGQPITLTWGFVADNTPVSDGEAIIGSSGLISTFNTRFGGDPLETDLREQPWFQYFDQAFARWSELSGATYIYEPNDPGGTLGSTAPGVLNFRPDVRIGGTSIDGASGTLAFNFFPNGGADMVLDTDDIGVFAVPNDGFVRLRNTIMHEHGHGFGVNHVTSTTDSLLMQPFISGAFDGPQLDEIRAVHFFFGDANEKSNGGQGNGTTATATPLGTLFEGGSLAVGTDANLPDQEVEPDATDFVSVSNAADVDVYSFQVSGPTLLGATLIPRGGVFTQAGQGGSPTNFNANARSDLQLAILDSRGIQSLVSVNDGGLGEPESLVDLLLPDAGTYFARIVGTEDTIQLYELMLTGSAFVEVLVGDYNGDGIVDASDYTVWRDTFGSNEILAADGNGNGTIDSGDYDLWRANFGSTMMVDQSASVAVPEPTAVSLMVLASLAHLFCLPRRRESA